jgi:hypothetical protein
LAEERLPPRREELARELCRGWYVGTREGKKQLLDELPKREGAPANRSASLLHDPEAALQFLERSLQEAGRDASDLELSRKGADWKVDLARHLKANFAVSNAWLSEHLKMGHPCAVSRLVSGKRSK